MLYRAVIFDLDGTLLDTIEDLAAAMNAALAASGLPQRPDVAEHKFFVGDGVRNYVLRALPADRRTDEPTVAAVTASYRAAYAAGWHSRTRPYEGIGDLLDALGGVGIRSAVLSNKPDDTTQLNVRHFFGPRRFEVVQGAADGLPLKPAPGGALVIATRMGIPPRQFAYVGDTGTDMRTAGAAGMLAVGALWGFRPPEELLAGGAKVLIRHPMDLVGVLG